jgi:hypothetical protein
VNKHDGGKRTPPTDNKDSTTRADTSASGERRRMGRIVHDDRGSASLEWRDAPDDYDRPVFRIEGTGVKESPLTLRNDDSFNPYERTPDKAPPVAGRAPVKSGGKRDLRKLGEWMKLMREMEERKKRGDDD